MIKFFRQSYAIQYVVVALLAIALWIPAFVSGKMTMGLGSPVTPIYNLVDDLLDFSSIAQHALAFLLLVLETLIFNMMLVKNQIVGKVSIMGAFVFVLLMSMTRTQTNFYPFALSAIFIILAINTLFEMYQLPNPEMSLLKTGVFIALASMCYFHSILLILWVMIVLPMAKKGTLRLQLISLTTVIKLLAAPLLALLLFYLVGIRGLLLTSLVISASAPSAANTVMFSVLFNRDTKLAVTLVSVSVLISLFTMPLVISMAMAAA